LLQDSRHHWFLTQTVVPDKGLARVVTTLGAFYDRIYTAYYKYAFWDAVPLFEFFCLARILPYMTTTSEKQCVMAGLQKICDDLSLSSGKAEEEEITRSGGSSSNEEEIIFEGEMKTTVIVPALGPDMGEFYPEGQIKLLAHNVRGPRFATSLCNLPANIS
jgi:hypothetical protein